MFGTGENRPSAVPTFIDPCAMFTHPSEALSFPSAAWNGLSEPFLFSSVTWERLVSGVQSLVRGRERSVSDDPPFVNAVYSPVSSVESRVAGWRSGTFPHASCGFFTGKL